MANRIGFREFLKKVDGKKTVELIVDANVIIASRDKKHRDYKVIQEFYDSLDELSSTLTLFTTVTTKSEFLEYYRRKTLTEGILALYNANRNKKVISDRVKAIIENQIRARNFRQKQEVQKQEKVEQILEAHDIDTTELDIEEFSIDANYFKDSELKEIKKAFRARNVDNEGGWISFCNKVLVNRLHALEGELDQLCHYLTTRDKESLKYFTKTDVEWRAATQICGESGMGYSDAMILNMANHTSIEHILTLDFDMVYGGHFSSPSKTIITPTDRLKNYKSILKGI